MSPDATFSKKEGHSLLRQASEKAALALKFNSTVLKGIPVKISGVIVFNFIPQ